MKLKRAKLSREDNPERYAAIEGLSEKLLLTIQEFLSNGDWAREVRLDALNAMAWGTAFLCIGDREDIPYELYDWFDDTLFEAIKDAEIMQTQQRLQQLQDKANEQTQ